jgi:hypothetical protein
METKGLLALWVNMDKAYRTEYIKFHNCEHIPDRLTIPGFYCGRRYQGIGKAPNYFVIYETSDAKVLASEPYLHQLDNPSPKAKEIIPNVRNTKRGIYSLIKTVGTKPPMDAPYVFVVRFSVKSESDSDVRKWYGEDYLPKMSIFRFA